MKRKDKKIKLIFRFLFLGFVLLFFAFALYYLIKKIPSFFIIENVEVNEKIEEDLKEKIKGKSLLTINLQEIRKSILKDHPEYKDVFILKKFPFTLKIEIVKRTPFAQWKAKEYFLLDEEGRIIYGPSNKPFFNFIPIEINDYKRSLRKGKKIKDKRLFCAFALIKEIKKREFFNRFPITLVNPTKLSSFYFIMKGIKIILGEGDLTKKIDLLETLLRREELKGNLARIKYIDLRYDKVYLGFKR
jgi:cell division septal protein FtsQ